MNSLGLLIYFVGLCERVEQNSTIVWVCLAIFSGIGTFVYWLISFCSSEFKESQTIMTEYGSTMRRTLYIAYACLAITIVFSTLFPSKQTAVLIASAEIGQRVVQNQQVQAAGNKVVNDILDPATNLLTAWIKKETANQQQQLEQLSAPKK